MPQDNGPPSNKQWIWMAGGFVVLTAVVLILLKPASSSPEEHPEETAAEAVTPPPERATSPPRAPAPEPAPASSLGSPGDAAPSAEAGASDPDALFAADVFDGPAPQLINDARARIARKKRLPANMRMDLYRYGKENPSDARPQLLLAFDEMRHRWYHAAMGHYEKALKADPQTVEHDKVLHDLVHLVTRGQKQRGTDAIQKHYGTRAIGAIDDAIAEARGEHDQRAAELLEELRSSL